MYMESPTTNWCAEESVIDPGFACVIAVILNASPRDAVTATPLGLVTDGTNGILTSVHCVAPSRRSSRGA